MKINEIEQGDKEHIPYQGIAPIVERLSKECSDAVYAMQMTNKFLYRGVKVGGHNAGTIWKPRILQGSAPTIFKSSSRENRKSLDTPNHIQDMIDGALEATGFTALRSNSIFCSGDKRAAMNYGVPYIIFPIDGFALTWSSNFVDLYSDAIEDKNAQQELLDQFEYDPGEWIFKIAKYNNTGLLAAINSKHEIMIKGEYYAIHHQFEPILRQYIFGQT